MPIADIILFQSTLPREERHLVTGKEHHSVVISIHAPTRGATKMRFFITININISIHAPTRGATSSLQHQLGLHRNFNPRSHERSDNDSCPIKAQIPSISIHAPTRGATKHICEFRNHFTISIHAPTRGATLPPVIIQIQSLISIHAPTRGAT